MKHLFLISLIFLLFGCKSLKQSPKPQEIIMVGTTEDMWNLEEEDTTIDSTDGGVSEK